MNTSLVKQLLHGQDQTMSAATCIAKFDARQPRIKAEAFKPMIPFTKGISLVLDQDLEAVLIAIDWLINCREAGSSTFNALLALAANYDTHPGMIALTLEVGMIMLKPRSALPITVAEHYSLVQKLYLANVAGIYDQMHDRWNLIRRAETPPAPDKMRSAWRQELGHDALIHPATLLPCRDTSGEILEYHGTSTVEGADFFRFKNRDGTVTHETPTFFQGQ